MGIEALDIYLLRLINAGLGIEALDWLVVFITNNNEPIFLLAVALIMRREKPRDVLVATALGLLSVALADAMGYTLKELIARDRPCHNLSWLRVLVYCGDSHSMPSNHAANSFAFATAIFLCTRHPIRWWIMGFAALVALSRPYVGVHYPSDVLAGALIGGAVAVIVCRGYAHIKRTDSLRDNPELVILTLIALFSAFRVFYIIMGPLDLSGDEAHYWDWSRRPALSYYSKGPLVAWLISIGTGILGPTELGVRWIGVLLSAATSWLVYMLGRELYDRRTGAYAAMVFFLLPLYSVYGILLTIDPPFIFLWTLALIVFWRILKSGSAWGWALLGVIVGVGMLAKYTMAFFFICAVLNIAVKREHRKLFASYKPYMGVALALAAFSPVLIWNWQNGWVTFLHTAGHVNVKAGAAINFTTFFEFIGGQMGVLTPIVGLLMITALIRRSGDAQGDFLFWFSAPILVFFLFKSLQGKVEANWAMMAYIAALIAFSRHYLYGLGAARFTIKAAVVMGLALAFLVTAIAFYPAPTGLEPKLHPSSRLKGWELLGSEVKKDLRWVSKQRFIFSDSYQTASLLAFYLPGQPKTYCINLGRRMNQFDLWPGPTSEPIGSDAIFVRINTWAIPDEVNAAFDYCKKRSVTAYDESGQRLRDYLIVRCSGYNGSVMGHGTPRKF